MSYTFASHRKSLWLHPFRTIAVAAVDVNGIYTWYSEPGANILCAAPSSGYRSDAISTTDLLSTWGYSQGGCTDTFGGTSAAAPQIAGVVALMLEARPELGWRDVQHILVESATRDGLSTSGWAANQSGREFSHDYGFGLVNAAGAVTLASNWQPVPPELLINSGRKVVSQTVADGSTVTDTSAVSVRVPSETI